MPRQTIEQRIERANRRLFNHRATRKSPVDSQRAKIVERVAWVATALVVYLVIAGGIYLALMDTQGVQVSEGGSPSETLKIVAPWVLPLFVVALCFDSENVRRVTREKVIIPAAHFFGQPFSINADATRWVVNLSESPGSPLREVLVQWLAVNEQGLLTKREHLVVMQWDQEMKRIHKENSELHIERMQQEDIRKILHESEIGREVQTIKQRQQIQANTPQVDNETNRRL